MLSQLSYIVQNDWSDDFLLSLTCNSSLQLPDFKVWSLTCSTMAGTSHCRESAAINWAKLGSPPHPIGAMFGDHFHPNNLISSSQNNTSALLILTMGVTTTEKPFYMVLKGFLTNPQRPALDDWISSHSLCFPHPSFSPLSWPVLAGEELLV